MYKGHYRERNYAEMFVDSKNFTTLQDSALVWKGEAYVADIKSVLIRFLGEKRANRALKIFFTKYNMSPDTQMADARLINFSFARFLLIRRVFLRTTYRTHLTVPNGPTYNTSHTHKHARRSSR